MLTTNQVAYVANEPRPTRLTTIARALELDHLRPGSGHTVEWSTIDALTVAFARALVESDPQRRYRDYRAVALWAAKMADADNPPGWIVITARQQHAYPADQLEQCAQWLLAHREAARVLCCAPILNRLAEASAPSAQ